MTDSFWTGGPSAYAKELREHYESQLDDLRSRQDQAGAAERAEINGQIERIEAEYKSKLALIDESLF